MKECFLKMKECFLKVKECFLKMKEHFLKVKDCFLKMKERFLMIEGERMFLFYCSAIKVFQSLIILLRLSALPDHEMILVPVSFLESIKDVILVSS